MKPLDFSCIVKCSKSQLTENGFKDAVVNEIYGGILECLHYSSSKIAFPELMVPALVQLRSFIKRCRIANYTKKIKQLLDKTNENVQFVLSKRRKVTDFGVRDLEKIRIWESALRQQGPPLSKFYESWSKVKEEETLKVMSDQVKLDDYNFIPKINNKKSKDKPIEEFKGIFGDDDDSDQVSNLIEIISRATVTGYYPVVPFWVKSELIFQSFQDDAERFELKQDRNRKRKEAPPVETEENTESSISKSKKAKKSDKKSEPAVVVSKLADEDDAEDEVKDFDMDEFTSAADEKDENVEDSSELDSEDSESQNELSSDSEELDDDDDGDN